MSIQISGRVVEGGKDPYVICAIDNNWKTIDDALASIAEAHTAGANAVKFSMYDYQSLYGIPKDKKAAYDQSNDLSEDWIPNLKAQCDRIGIDLIVSVCNPDHVRIVDPYVNAHHVSSGDINYVSLLRELVRIRKPVFLHVGCASNTEIQYALSILDTTPVILMYGVDSHPEPAKQVDLTLIDQLKVFCDHVGFFDLTTDSVYLPYAAMKFHKACVIEKHMTTIKGATADYKYSLDLAGFKTMVERLRGKGKGFLGRAEMEHNMLMKRKRRLIATANIKLGEILRFDKNFGMYASPKSDSTGRPAIEYMDLDGKAAAKDIDIGEPLAKGSFVE